jgi:hypothetical protein
MGIFRRAGIRDSFSIFDSYNMKLFISLESNIEKLVSMATLPPSFPPSGKLPF